LEEALSTLKRYCFDDVLLVPQHSEVKSRLQVDLKMKLGKATRPSAILELDIPVIASPMDSVCDHKMVNAIGARGGIGIIHRYMSRESMFKEISLVKERFGVAVSSADCFDQEYISQLVDLNVSLICVDTANGHSDICLNAVDELNQYLPKHVHIMAGNVATEIGFKKLLDAGADSIRVGIGGGSACTTRIVSGHGVPTLGSVMSCSSIYDRLSKIRSIVADGGIRNTGDMVKSFAAGANAVMLGRMLAGFKESPIVLENGKRVFRGMASRQAQLDWKGKALISEGASAQIQEKGSVNKLIDEIIAGIGSGCSYTGVNSLSEIFYRSKYIPVSANAIKESMPHINGSVFL
jgi:IMP dehydrogenase